MVGNKYNGDAIAIEFLRLMKTAKQNSPTLEKKAEEAKPEDFLTSEADRELLIDQQARVVQGIAEGILRYLEATR